MESIVFSKVSENVDLISQENVESLDEILRAKIDDKPTTEEHDDEDVPKEGLAMKSSGLSLTMLPILSTKHQNGIPHQEPKNQYGMVNFRNEKLASLKLSHMKSIPTVGESKNVDELNTLQGRLSASTKLENLVDSTKTKVKNLNQLADSHGTQLSPKVKMIEGAESLESIKQRLIKSEDSLAAIEDSLPVLKKDHVSKHKSIEAAVLPMTTLLSSTAVSSNADAQPKASLLHGSSLEAKIQVAVENRKTLETSSMESNSLIYRFQRWGGDYSVSIQPQSGAMMLSPSDALVEQKLNDNWFSGNPHRWHLVQEENKEGRHSQNQHMTDDEED